MNVSLSIGPIVALIAGIMILIVPRLLNYIIALYLIVIGVWASSAGRPRGSARTPLTRRPRRAARGAHPRRPHHRYIRDAARPR